MLAAGGGALTQAQELRHEINLSGGAGLSSMRYDVLGGDNPMRFGLRAGLGYTFFFNDRWGIGTGVEFARYNNRVALPDGLRHSTPMSAYDDLQYVVGMTGFVETQKLSMVNIPLTVQFNAPAGKKVRLYALAGGKIGLPVKASWSQSAASITTGRFNNGLEIYYYEGQPVNNHTAKGDLTMKPAFMLTGELGAKFRLSPQMWLYAGGYIDYGLNNIRKGATDEANIVFFDDPDYADITPGNHSLLEMASATSDVKLLSFGFNLRLGFGWGKKKAKPVPVVLPPPPAPEPVVIPEPEPEPVVEIPQEVKKVMIDLSNTLFAFDRFNLTDEAIVELNKVAAWLNENPELHIEISGHTDSVGTDVYNLRLSESRAKSVHNYLLEQGVSVSRLSYKGYGESEPIADNSTAEGRRQNRRVELKIIDN